MVRLTLKDFGSEMMMVMLKEIWTLMEILMDYLMAKQMQMVIEMDLRKD